MKVLLIGGSSDLGREIGKQLNFDFINYDISNKNIYVKNYQYFDLTDVNSLELLKTNSFDAIIHITGIHPLSGDLNLMNKINVIGLNNVLKNMNCSKFIYISTTSVDKDTEYGKSKKNAEKLIIDHSFKHQIQTFILRTRGFTPYYSKHYDNFVDYANWTLQGSVNIKDVVNSINLSLKSTLRGCTPIRIDGKQDLLESDSLSHEFLIKKFPLLEDFIKKLDIPQEKPTYKSEYNNLGYYPKYGIFYIFEEYLTHINTRKILF